MVQRQISQITKELAVKYPFVVITGPRQSGKTTLTKTLFPDYDYVSLEELDNREFARQDPRGFIATYPDRVIIDEVQRVPELLSYLQTHSDNVGEEGMYILTGSQNLLLMDAVDQSLAGRAGMLTLLPFSHQEMMVGGICPKSVEEEIFKGALPRVYDKQISPVTYYSNYIKTYVERDVRMLKNISDLSTFTRFLKLCAGRVGQLLNMASLANDCGISVPTAKAWLSVLEASFVVHFLRPDYNNFSKRLVKTPKLYFCDTGLACNLLEIASTKQLSSHYLKGGLFENLVVNEMLKSEYNSGCLPQLSFWRDSNGNEIDLLRTRNGVQTAIEIKSGQTFSTDYVKGLRFWSQMSGNTPDNCVVVYAGSAPMQTSDCALIPWTQIGRLV